MEEYISFTVPGYEPEYFYRVYEFMTTFGADEGKHKSFSHEEDFKGYDLLTCRKSAYEYYHQRYNGLSILEFYKSILAKLATQYTRTPQTVALEYIVTPVKYDFFHVSLFHGLYK